MARTVIDDFTPPHAFDDLDYASRVPSQRDFTSFSLGQSTVRVRERRSNRREQPRHKVDSGIAGSQFTPVSVTPDSRVEEKAPTTHEHESWAPHSSSTSTISRFMDRLGTNTQSLSSLRTIPSWRSSLFPNTSKTYAKMEVRHEDEGSHAPDLRPPRGAILMPPPQHSSSSNLQNRSLCLRHQDKVATSHDDEDYLSHTSTSLSNLLARFPRPMANSNEGPSSGSSSSLNTHQSSDDSRASVPSSSEDSYPSPYSVDAIAVFQTPPDKNEGRFFDGRRKRGGVDILENQVQNQVQVIFAEAADGTSASLPSVHIASRHRDVIGSLRRRVKALASSVLLKQRKVPTMFHNERRLPRLDDYDYDSAECDIPCLAYISCLW
ncbi:hypothetical protein B0F90DRAFT_1817375 [Multifurca ochricompacta]|uniref:Uncharacterized protein n=1 Tax=Multifurca ochricompacta TaxID=376703 RepID=A0AAD4M3C5_9AGAM|nr:hypothetical protein B0F90DRAFT_1817375 [Multifurca ochricompacta]